MKVDINDVRNNRLYKQFKKEVTSELLDIFFEGLGYDASQHPKVDTVIFSGRSSRLKEIRDSFQEALEKWGVSNCNIVQLRPTRKTTLLTIATLYIQPKAITEASPLLS
ncbi:MAG: hypothetical protein V8Q76_15680 [Bacteroides intestinalis]